ncbi:MAG: Uma2 family endonuclease [Oscillospiraceae bacterium]|nr:Uma2 family endonuclease [Oscillospiraceae bacterium]
MSVYMPMSTTIRHNKITSSLFGNIFELVKKNKVLALQEECALVHWGLKRKADISKLVNIEALDDAAMFIKDVIDDLDYVMPDFLVFKDNKYLCNERETRIAGLPDLIIEVWSKSNAEDERNFKFDLYSGSPSTEHWYIEQDSNKVACYFGSEKLEEQSLSSVLLTRSGLKFDLRYLSY